MSRLSLRDFRCHADLRLEVTGASVVLTGGNGIGKTSVLEALSLLTPGRGLRRARLAEISRRNDPSDGGPWAVSARLDTAAGPVDIATGLEPGSDRGGERRIVRIDGAPARTHADLVRILGLLWLTPDMDRLFQDGPSARRRFLDRLVYAAEPAHAACVSAYERAMQERLRLLVRGGADPAWLRALERTMASEGSAIARARVLTAERLERMAADWGGLFPGFSIEVAATSGAVAAADEAGRRADTPLADTLADNLADALAAARSVDAAAGTTTVGPHRCDVVVRDARTGRNARDCSTGEQKALLIALVLAGAWRQRRDRGSAPLLLLDEVAAHLDRRHRLALFAAVDALGCQAWYAGTDRAVFAPLCGRATIIALEDVIATPATRASARESQGSRAEP